jgi:ERF superfamily
MTQAELLANNQTLAEARSLPQPAPVPPRVGPSEGDIGPSSLVLLFERLASNKDVDVDKFQKLLDMQERILRYAAEKEYYAAFSVMQGELPEISEQGEIIVNGSLRSRYARNEDIQRAVKPILQKHGFALSFRNTFKDGLLTITGVLAHRSGHTEQDEFIAKADDSGSKNAIQALGSTRSYGQRYVTTALLNIATRDPTGKDDDGHGSETKPESPKGYADWILDLTAVADTGLAALQVAFQQSAKPLRKYLTEQEPTVHAALKVRATEADKKAAAKAQAEA